MLPLLALFELADLLVTRGLEVYDRVKDLPVEGSAEDHAKIAALKTRLAVTSELVQSLPILPPPGGPPGPI